MEETNGFLSNFLRPLAMCLHCGRLKNVASTSISTSSSEIRRFIEHFDLVFFALWRLQFLCRIEIGFEKRIECLKWKRKLKTRNDCRFFRCRIFISNLLSEFIRYNLILFLLKWVSMEFFVHTKKKQNFDSLNFFFVDFLFGSNLFFSKKNFRSSFWVFYLSCSSHGGFSVAFARRSWSELMSSCVLFFRFAMTMSMTLNLIDDFVFDVCAVIVAVSDNQFQLSAWHLANVFMIFYDIFMVRAFLVASWSTSCCADWFIWHCWW